MAAVQVAVRAAVQAAVQAAVKDTMTPQLQIQMTTSGIGDNVQGLLAVCGLKVKHPTCQVAYIPSPGARPWVELFNGPDLLLTVPIPGVRNFRIYDSYKLELSQKGAKSRAEYYAMFADNCKPVLPTVKPLDYSPNQGAVVLSPFCCWDSRQWLLTHWLELERLLHKAGYTTVVVDDKLTRTARFKGTKLLGKSAREVASTIRVAKAFIGNDSGMAHVAGLLGTPTLVLIAAAKGSQVYGCYPSAQWLTGPLSCSGCYWSGDDYHEGCNKVCASLNAIRPQDVVERVRGL